MKRKLLTTVLTLSLALVSITGCSTKNNESNNDVNVDINADVEESKNENETLADSTVEEVVENEDNSKTELNLADELKEKITETGVQFTIGEKVYTIRDEETTIDEMISDGYVDASVLNEDNFKEIINKNYGLVPVVNENGETIATVQIDNEHYIRSIKNWSDDVSLGILSDITVAEWEANFAYDYDDGEKRYTILEFEWGTIGVHFEKDSEGNWKMSRVGKM